MTRDSDFLADQIRAYGDALEDSHLRSPGDTDGTFGVDSAAAGGAAAGPVADRAVVGISQATPPRDRSMVLIAAAALIVLLAGSTAWMLRDSGESIVQTDVTDETGPTTLKDPTTKTEQHQDGSQLRVLPSMEEWTLVRTETFGDTETSGDIETSGETDPVPLGGLWVWRVDGKPVTVISSFNGEVGDSLVEAEVQSDGNRVLVGWQVGDETVAMQGLDITESRLIQLARSLVQSAEGWELPGAEVIVAEPAMLPTGGDQITASFATRSAEGAPGLVSEVEVSITAGSEADMYRELFESGSLGVVSEEPMLGESGFVIRGELGSSALVALDGAIVRVHPTRTWANTNIDLFLESLSVVDNLEWQGQVDQIEQNLEQAAAEAIVNQGLTGSTRRDAIVLPRYVLPEPYEFEWVTDFGLWTEEERAQREALFAGNQSGPPQVSELVLTQGFARTEIDADGASANRPTAVGLLVPEVVVEVLDLGPGGSGGSWSLAEDGTNPFVFNGLKGYSLDRSQRPPLVFVVFGNERFEVQVSSRRLSETELRDFVLSLGLVGDDLSTGFETRTSGFIMVAEDGAARDGALSDSVPGGSGSTGSSTSSSVANGWSAGYLDDAGGSGGPVVRVVELTTSQFLFRTAGSYGVYGIKVESFGDHLYALSPDIDELSESLDEFREFATVVRYDPSAGYATYALIEGEVEEALALFDSLVEVDIGTWAEVVGPYNAEPLKPR